MRSTFHSAVWAGLITCLLALGAREASGQPTRPLRLSTPVPEDSRPAASPAPVPDQSVVPPEQAQAGLLTIQQLEQMAATNNPTLVQAARPIQALQAEQLQVGLYPNPVLGYQSEEIGEQGQAGQHGMYFRQEIVTANKLGLNRAVVSHEVQQAQWEFEMQQRRVSNDVRLRAYEVLAAQRTMEVVEELVEIGQAAADTADRLYRARQVSQVDVLQARVEANSARLQLVAARKTYDAAWRRLAAVVGLPDMQPATLADSLDDSLPDLSWDATLGEMLAQSPQVAHARSGVEQARCAVARALAGRTPNIETGAAVRYIDESDSTTVSLQVGVPLMVYDRNQGNIMKARAMLSAAQQNVQRVELLLQDQLAAAFREFDIAREQVVQYRQDVLPDAKRSLELTRAGYEQNEFGYLELLTAQQTYSRTNLAYIGRLRDLWLSAIEIDGMLLSGGLNSPDVNR